MIGRALGCVVVCGCLMAGASLQAHHSLAGVYDMKGEKEIAGTLTQIKFVNPHGSLTITVKNPDGTTTDWVFTTGSATTLADRGITKVGPKALKIGEPLTAPIAPPQKGVVSAARELVTVVGAWVTTVTPPRLIAACRCGRLLPVRCR